VEAAEALIRACAQQRRTGMGEVEQSLQMAYPRWLHTQGIPWERARGPQDDSAEPDGWLVTNRELHSRRASGLTCFEELETYGRTGVRASVDRPVNNSKGGGGVMRATPIALWSDDPATVFALGAESAALAAILRQLPLGSPLRAAIDVAAAQLIRQPRHDEQLGALNQALELAEQGPPTPEKLETLGQGGTGHAK
jgi:hypothetical protein